MSFGPDVTREFLDNNKLKMVVRSHECVYSGKCVVIIFVDGRIMM